MSEESEETVCAFVCEKTVAVESETEFGYSREKERESF